MTHIQIKNASLRFRVYKNRNPALKEAVIGKVAGKNHEHHVEFDALQNINLHVAGGDRLGIIGLNGAGKSTLLKMIVGIYPPHSGSVSVEGKITPLIELGTGFDTELSGRENIYLNGSLLGRSFQQMRGVEAEIVDFSGLRNLIDMPIKYYSSGMHGRLAFSIGTLAEPEILLLDEIFATGDSQFVQKASKRMKVLVDSSQIVILVSHDLDKIVELCNRAIVLHKGKIVAQGTPRDMVDFYLNEVVSWSDDDQCSDKGSEENTIEPMVEVSTTPSESIQYKSILLSEGLFSGIQNQTFISEVVVDTDEGRFSCHVRDRWFGWIIASEGGWDPAVTGVVKRAARDCTLAVDVGAGIGWHSVAIAKSLAPEGRLLCFEPEPLNYNLLKRNLALNSLSEKCWTEQVAIGDRDAQMDLELSSDNFADHRLRMISNAERTEKLSESKRETIRVPANRLDTLIARVGFGDQEIGFMNIAVQGAEVLVLRGAAKAVQRTQRLVIVFWPYGLLRLGCKSLDFINCLEPFFAWFSCVRGSSLSMPQSDSEAPRMDIKHLKRELISTGAEDDIDALYHGVYLLGK